MPGEPNNILPSECIQERIYLLRGQRVMLDFDLAALYGVSAKVLNQAVKRNMDRFPEDFMFQLSDEETLLVMRSQIVGEQDENWSQVVTSSDATSSKSMKATTSNWSPLRLGKQKHRGLTYRPYAFTEQGVAMLSSVLRSPRAVKVNIEIMRTFVRLRQMLASNAELARKLEEMEKKYDKQFRVVFEAIRQLMKEPASDKASEKREIGFHTLRDSPGFQMPKRRRNGNRVRY